MYSIKAIKQIKMRHWTYLFGFSRACMATDVRKLWTATEAGVQYHTCLHVIGHYNCGISR